MEIITIIQSVAGDYSPYVFAAVSIASVIASVTPTPKAGTTWAKVYRFIDMLAVNVGKAKDK